MKKHEKTKRGKHKESVHVSRTAPVLEISPAKQRLFRIAAFLIPVLILVLLETGLRLFQYDGDTALFVPTPNKSSAYYGINRNVGRRYFFVESFIPSPRKDLFLIKKPKNCYRIFVLGGSTAAGFPYGNNVTFARILNRRLSDTFPDRRIEIVNTAMTAICSYTLSDFMDEILDCQPDAILIYAGHNEFYGALGVGSMETLGQSRWIVKTYLKLLRFKTMLLLRDVIGKARQQINNTAHNVENDPMQTVMARIVKDPNIPLGSKTYELGKKQFYLNLKDIFQKAKKARVPVMISELVSNVHDQEPFVSIKTDTCPSAETVFHMARDLEKKGEYVQARSAYYRAKDLDALRFRASEEFNRTIHRVASEFNVPTVPMKSCFENASPHGLIGNNLIHEHLHPNIDGYFDMADAFYETMRKERFISDHWDENNIKPSSYYRKNWGYTALDSVYAALCIVHLKGGWPFKMDSGPNRALDFFKPATKADSIALAILKNGNSTLELGHIELAKYYEKMGELERAYREYEALIYTVPALDLFYQPAVLVLVKMNQYDRALKILYEALKYQETDFVDQWIGQILLVLDQPGKGIWFLERARKLSTPDEQLLFNLSRAYYKTNQRNKGDEILAELKKISPNSPFIIRLETEKTNVKGQ
jgi:tetratricopeptide (TPR) repeat protein